jgi:trehalose 6-phosphate phosphatase
MSALPPAPPSAPLHTADASLAAPPALSAGASLFLDFDGTLAEIAPVPDAVELAPGMLEALRAACDRVAGRVALLSGRPVATLLQLVPMDRLAMAGVHGLERRQAGAGIEAPPPHPGLETARPVLQALVAREPHLVLEDKGLSISLHYRGAPALRAEATKVVRALAERHGLVIQSGKMVLELRTPGADKGDALRAFMAEPPFAGFTPVFVGDDDTDEAAFRAALALGGHGIRVGGRTGETTAAYALPDIFAVGQWLAGA